MFLFIGYHKVAKTESIRMRAFDAYILWLTSALHSISWTLTGVCLCERHMVRAHQRTCRNVVETDLTCEKRQVKCNKYRKVKP